MRVAILTESARAGDAIGNQVAEKAAFFLERGAEVRVFIESKKRLHPALGPYSVEVTQAEPEGDPWHFLASADLILVE